jgi:hypothetical protein
LPILTDSCPIRRAKGQRIDRNRSHRPRLPPFDFVALQVTDHVQLDSWNFLLNFFSQFLYSVLANNVWPQSASFSIDSIGCVLDTGISVISRIFFRFSLLHFR